MNTETNTNTDPNNQEILKGWGISLDLISGFQPSFTSYQNRPAVILATGKESRRRVIFLDGDQPKVKWYFEDSDKPQPVLFNTAALQTPGNTLIKLNGEKSVLAALSAGIIHAFSTPNGENKQSDIRAAIDYIRLHSDKRRILIYPDCDSTGTRDAKLWSDWGTAAGLTIEIYDLRQHLQAKPKWDTRDLWLLQQNPEVFQTQLNTLPLFDFNRYADELPAKKDTVITKTETFTSRSDTFNQAVIEALEAQLLAVGRRRKDGSIGLPSWSGHHKRDKPGLHTVYYSNNGENPLAVEFSTGEIKGIKELCALFNIDYLVLGGLYKTQDLEIPRNTDLSRVPETPITSSVPDIPDGPSAPDNSLASAAPTGLPTKLRQAMVATKAYAVPTPRPKPLKKIKVFENDQVVIKWTGDRPVRPTSFIRMLDILLSAGYEGCSISVQQAFDVCESYGISLTTLKRILKSSFYVGTKLVHFEIISIGQDNSLVFQNGPNSRGRPLATLYRVPTIEELELTYGRRYLPSIFDDEVLPQEALKENKMYRAYSLLEHVPQISTAFTQADLAKKLNISQGTVSKYMKLLEERQAVAIERNQVDRKVIKFDDIPAFAAKLADKKGGNWLEMYNADGSEFHHKGGESKRPNNRIPVEMDAVLYFAQFVHTFKACHRKPNMYTNLIKRSKTVIYKHPIVRRLASMDLTFDFDDD
jgi:hypothetical protein